MNFEVVFVYVMVMFVYDWGLVCFVVEGVVEREEVFFSVVEVKVGYINC